MSQFENVHDPEPSGVESLANEVARLADLCLHRQQAINDETARANRLQLRLNEFEAKVANDDEMLSAALAAFAAGDDDAPNLLRSASRRLARNNLALRDELRACRTDQPAPANLTTLAQLKNDLREVARQRDTERDYAITLQSTVDEERRIVTHRGDALLARDSYIRKLEQDIAILHQTHVPIKLAGRENTCPDLPF